MCAGLCFTMCFEMGHDFRKLNSTTDYEYPPKISQNAYACASGTSVARTGECSSEKGSWSAALRRSLSAWQTFSGKFWLAGSKRSSFEDTKLFKEKWNLMSFEKSHPIILILFSPFAFYCCFKCFKTVSAIMLSKVSFQSQIHIFWHPKTATTEKKTCVDVTQSALSCHKCCLTSSR